MNKSTKLNNNLTKHIIHDYEFYMFIKKIHSYEPYLIYYILSILLNCKINKITSCLIPQYNNIQNLLLVESKLITIFNDDIFKYYNSLDIYIILTGLYKTIKQKKETDIYVKDIDITIVKRNCISVLNNYDKFDNLGFFEEPIYDTIINIFVKIKIYTNYTHLTYIMYYNPRTKYFYFNHKNNCPTNTLNKIITINEHLDIYFYNWGKIDVFSIKNKKQKLLNNIIKCTNIILEDTIWYKNDIYK